MSDLFSPSQKHLRIALLPLDERPCNRAFPARLFDCDAVHILLPESLSHKKTPADFDQIDAFLQSAADADALILSLDMLLYGGLLPSRIHHLSEEELTQRFSVLPKLKAANPQLIIYAFQCIMRCPDYSSSEEEPDYYAQWGKELRDYGVALHHKSEETVPGPWTEEADLLCRRIPEAVRTDYLKRRKCNRSMNLHTLSLLEAGILDALVIPQDDCAPYGFSGMDRLLIEEQIQKCALQDRVMTYPGADEAGLTLIARFLNTRARRSPRCYVHYAMEEDRLRIPLYEGQALERTVSAHLISAGCKMVQSAEQADFVLALTGPTADMLEAEDQPDPGNAPKDTSRSLPGFLEQIEAWIRAGIPVAIGDNAYANGADLRLIAALNAQNLLRTLCGYAGWNTNANTLGTAIAQAVASLHLGSSQKLSTFLLERYFEDAGYCALVRAKAMELTERRGLSVDLVEEIEPELLVFIRSGLEDFAKTYLTSYGASAHLESVRLPWHRLFEVDLTASPEA